MSAYIMGRIKITDKDLFAKYGELVPAVVKQYGGRYLIRGGESRLLEGEAPNLRTVVIEFPDRAAALSWYDSPEYIPLREMRMKASEGSLMVVDGV